MKKILFLFFTVAYIQAQQHTIQVNWLPAQIVKIGDLTLKLPAFSSENMDYEMGSRQLWFSEILANRAFIHTGSVKVISTETEPLSEADLYDLPLSEIGTSVQLSVTNTLVQDNNYVNIRFLPIIKQNGQLVRVTKLELGYSEGVNEQRMASPLAIENSVLDNGSWYRFYVTTSGVYKLSKSFLQGLGVNVGSDPRTLQIYSYGGKMLPLQNGLSAFDLPELAIQVIGEEDGVFNDSDYVLVYCEGVDQWTDENQTSQNLYADKAYYYVTSGTSSGKRIPLATQPSDVPVVTFTNYDHVMYYEKDLVNFTKASRKFFGEQFIIKNEQTFSFSLPNLDTSIPLQVKASVASVSYGSSSFTVKANGQDIGTAPFGNLSTAQAGTTGYENYVSGTIPATAEVSVTLTYDNGGIPTSNGYLDYIAIQSKRKLNGYGKQFIFYNDQTAQLSGTGQFTLTNALAVPQVWDITDIYNVSRYDNLSGTFSFLVSLGTVRKYIALDDSDYYTPSKDVSSSVSNQNLKSTVFLNDQGVFEDVDYLIITHPSYYTVAEKLAQFHREYSQLNTKVVTLDKIYHEFSSGKPDVAAIRNFIRYVYTHASSTSKRVKYVNMFGDTTYDYKNRLKNNNNVVPVFQAVYPVGQGGNFLMNTSLITAFMSDDFFGLMDVGEGSMTSSFDGIDIAVGRMPVSSLAQAEQMVAKIVEYYQASSYGKWRNNYVIYADDPEVGDEALQASINSLADNLTTQKPFVNMKKILSDAYKQQVSAGGERYPDAKKDFLNHIELGTLVLNYIGHGGEQSLAAERLFEYTDAQALTNKGKYPLFITMTCEFTRFDDPDKPTGGEYMYWNPTGGAIALIATTRPIYASNAIEMNNKFSEKAFAFGSNEYPTIAEALRLTKLQIGSNNRRVVFCVGDPALKLAIPKAKIILTHLNDVLINETTESLKALSLVKLSGQVTSETGSLLSNYNGDLSIQIFDKMLTRNTLNNEGTGSISFTTLGETIFRGNTTVNNGIFTIQFVVPKDIRIAEGTGKVSLYAKRKDLLEDQAGYDLTVKVGGQNTTAPQDTTPPVVQLYLNDTSFVNGSITNNSPILLAYLEDEHGINTASGIGHDIEAILDGDTENPYVLNDYYETENNNFTKGKVKFQFSNLSVGSHTLTLKAWDVYNNLITAEIHFVVMSSEEMALTHVLNYPNPFVNYTEFWFTHNKPFEPLQVQVQVFTISGKLVKTITQVVVTDGFLCRSIQWDGKDDFGDAIGKGVYVYKLSVKSEMSGQQAEKYEKLVIL